MSRPDGPVVVKLGGSFAFSDRLTDWIEALATCRGRVVIVPGGGPFADTVRAAQVRIGFDDAAAHHMALLAMEQYGRALASRNATLSLAASVAAIRNDLISGRVPVWMPSRMVLGASDISASWDVTSDSLAAWLSGKIGASRLFLVKRTDASPTGEHFERLAAAGIVDKAFPQYLKMSAATASILGPSDHAAVAAAIRDAPGQAYRAAGVDVRPLR